MLKSSFAQILCVHVVIEQITQKLVPKSFKWSNLSYISPDGKEWVCKTCDRTLKRGTLPLQAKANCLQLCPVPPELSVLNVRLICLRVPFMKMVALPTGKQRSNMDQL